jgi:DNA-binding NarL/FixJ family response regulator
VTVAAYLVAQVMAYAEVAGAADDHRTRLARLGFWPTACGSAVTCATAGLATRALVLTTYDDVTVLAAPCKGVRLHTQGAGPNEIVAAAGGEALFGAGIATHMLQHAGRAATSSPFSELTERETEVLDFVGRGAGQRGGRTPLWGQPKTVHNHASNIITKLHVSAQEPFSGHETSAWAEPGSG